MTEDFPETYNPDFWLKPLIVPVNTNTLTAMAVHGALCLALRHPDFKGKSRQLVVEFTKSLGEWLVHAGALTPEQLRSAEELEAKEGSPDMMRVKKRSIEVWQKKHHALMSNIHEDEIFFPVYDQSNRICSYNFHKIIENPPKDITYSGAGDLYGDAASFWYSPSTKKTYMSHRLLNGYFSAEYRTVTEDVEKKVVQI
jgi:hypothetical protein